MRLRLLGAATVCLALAGLARASLITVPQSALIPSTSYYTNNLGPVVVMTGGDNEPGIGVASGRNDDGFSGPISLGFTLHYFGHDYTQFWVNNNGSISFNGGIAAFTPQGPQGAPQPIISPFFADVDTRNPLSGVAHLNQSIPNETIVTWDNVGYFDGHADKFDSFQLVLRGPDYVVPLGEGSIGFFWKTMQWETGDASGGVDGFGGVPAAVGFGDGLDNGEVLQNSLQDGISGVVNNEKLWFDPNLNPITPPATTPEPASFTLLGVGAVGLLVAGWRRRTRILTAA